MARVRRKVGKLTEDDLLLMRDLIGMHGTDTRKELDQVIRCHRFIVGQLISRKLDALTREAARDHNVSEKRARAALKEWRAEERARLERHWGSDESRLGTGEW